MTRIQWKFIFSNILNRGFANCPCIILLNLWQYYQLQSQVKPETNVICSRHLIRKVKKLCLNVEVWISNVAGQTNSKDTCFGMMVEEHDVEGCCLCKCCNSTSYHNELQSLCYVPFYCMTLLDHMQHCTYKPLLVIVIAALIFQSKLKDMFESVSNDLRL